GAALYVGGAFDSAGLVRTGAVARWDGNWSALGEGVNGVVRALFVFDDGSGPALYVGGRLLSAGGIAAHGVARWNGRSWASAGDGPRDGRAFAAFDADGTGLRLFAGAANGVWERIAGGWVLVAGGVSSSATSAPAAVHALEVYDDGTGHA